MRAFDLSKSTIVFDLDDTLYPEADYVESGVRDVCLQIERIYGADIYPALANALEDNSALDWLGLACQLAGLPCSVKESLLWMYRLHTPDIHLSQASTMALQRIESAAGAVAVLTDGRSVTQRLKLKSLGLAHLPVYISEDYGAAKPAPDGFLDIQNDLPSQHYFYVADNPRKDFLGCNPLGWVGIGMRGNHRNVHAQTASDRPLSALPAYWVNSWEELTSMLFED